jgi:hypothetical protein
MIDGKLQQFVAGVVARAQITFGDVRRLQRIYLPTGITNPEELETLISLNAKISRADSTWAKWLVAAVADFAARAQGCEHSIDESAGKLVDEMLAASPASLGRRIGRQIRRELARRQAMEPGHAIRHQRKCERDSNIPRLSQAGIPENVFPTVWSEMMLGPSHRAVLQLTATSIRLAA